ncbi:ITA10 protein, partial [Columbina picui]|nr:ITA10 protein [Columbina picui]
CPLAMACRLLVAAPWDGDGQGDVYKCRVGPPNATCDKGNLGSTTPLLSPPHRGRLGMTLVDAQDGGFVVRGETGARGCGGVGSWAVCPHVPICPHVSPHVSTCCSTYMDIVIVLDGSNSIYPWVEVQNFLSNILSRFFIGPGQIQVGVLQYGEHAVHEWALGRYRSVQEVVEAARNISRQEGRETRTAMAIRTAWCVGRERGRRGAGPGVGVRAGDG